MFRKNLFATYTILSMALLLFKSSYTEASVNGNHSYIFLTATPGNQNYSTTYYVSGIIDYNGDKACCSAAEEKFLNYLENNYGLDKSDWKIHFNGPYGTVDYPSTSWSGWSSESDAEKEIDNYTMSNMKKVTTGFTFQCSSGTIKQDNTASTQSNEGKAWWCTYYLDEVNMKLYISYVYNNDCDHCSNEITADFKKWLILNDYVNSPSAVNITSLHDVNEKSLEERRKDTLLKYKERGFAVFNLSYKYNN